MFDNFRDRLQAVQHDLTIGWKSITDKAKAQQEISQENNVHYR